ncbi:heat-inducible transcriptional repressor HrcA [Atopobacter phocae]|uniref:heat-inducible transcriptional repressor HrcA n=1 Tax=Atopobacter phocae TaxID=136492 RepID=UPI00046FDDE9|nr:heat-inducible transcriptional repressor HrcA [Atopobacter phocae]
MLTKRQLHIFQLIIQLYSELKEPIGSKTLLENSDLTVSSATLRNEMVRLESLGLIEKNHLSSGRIPSNKGYRFYVDKILPFETSDLNQMEATDVNQLLKESAPNLEFFMNQTADLFSQKIHFTTLSIGLTDQKRSITNIRLISISPQHLMVVILFSDHTYEEEMIRLVRAFSPERLKQLEMQLNHLLANQSIHTAIQQLKQWINEKADNYERLEELFISQVLSPLNQKQQLPLYVSGKRHLLDSTNDLELIKRVYRLVEDESLLTRLTRLESPLEIRIGDEIGVSGLEDYSIISARLSDGEQQGLLAVMGPTNMPYREIYKLLQYINKAYTEKNM